MIMNRLLGLLILYLASLLTAEGNASGSAPSRLLSELVRVAIDLKLPPLVATEDGLEAAKLLPSSTGQTQTLAIKSVEPPGHAPGPSPKGKSKLSQTTAGQSIVPPAQKAAQTTAGKLTPTSSTGGKSHVPPKQTATTTQKPPKSPIQTGSVINPQQTPIQTPAGSSSQSSSSGSTGPSEPTTTQPPVNIKQMEMLKKNHDYFNNLVDKTPGVDRSKISEDLLDQFEKTIQTSLKFLIYLEEVHDMITSSMSKDSCDVGKFTRVVKSGSNYEARKVTSDALLNLHKQLEAEIQNEDMIKRILTRVSNLINSHVSSLDTLDDHVRKIVEDPNCEVIMNLQQKSLYTLQAFLHRNQLTLKECEDSLEAMTDFVNWKFEKICNFDKLQLKGTPQVYQDQIRICTSLENGLEADHKEIQNFLGTILGECKKWLSD